MLYDRAGKSSRELLPAWDRDAQRYLFVPDGKALLIESIDAARTKIFRVALADAGGRLTAEGGPAPIVSERNNTALSADRAGHTIAWLRDAIDQPPGVIVATLSAGGISAVRALTHANDSLLAAVRMYPAEDFWFKSVRGDSVQGMVVRPPQWAPGEMYPVVLAIHGGPQSAWLDSWSTRWNAELLASPGYGVLLVNPRGSHGYGQKFTDGVTGEWGGAAYADLMNGLDAALQRFPWLDGTRAAAAGGSYGGYMVNWIAGHNTRFKTLVSHAGVYDLEAMSGATDELWFTEWEFEGSYWDPLAMATQYRTWSPHLYAKDFRTPMLVIAGEQDYRVPYTESLSLFGALQRQGVPIAAHRVPRRGALDPQAAEPAALVERGARLAGPVPRRDSRAVTRREALRARSRVVHRTKGSPSSSRSHGGTMRKPWIVIATLAAAGCSSGGATGAGAEPTVTQVVQNQQLNSAGTQYDLTTIEDHDVMITAILAPMDSVWRVLPGVFLELGVEPGTVDQQRHYIANTSFTVRRSLGGKRLSLYVDCGSTVAGPTADHVAVTMSLTVQVVRDSSELSHLRTQLNAYAIQEGTAGIRMHCGTTGALEDRISRMVNDDLKARAKK